MAKRPVPLYDFKAFGAAIKAARNEYGESRKKVSDELYISPRYLATVSYTHLDVYKRQGVHLIEHITDCGKLIFAPRTVHSVVDSDKLMDVFIGQFLYVAVFPDNLNKP